MTTYTGTNGNNVIFGSTGDDTIYGLGGHDHLFGRGGDDTIHGGDGNDHIEGGAGDDSLHGGDGHDVIDGGAGNDTITGGDHGDFLSGGDGDDDISGNDGHDLLFGGGGDDTLAGNGGADLIDGGAGTDTAVYSGAFFEYSIYRFGPLTGVVHDGPCGPGSGADGADLLVRVERLRFADLTIDLTANNAPFAFNDAAALDEDDGSYDSGAASVLDNDFDFEGDAMTVTSGTFSGTYGTLTMNADGNYVYVLNANAQTLAQGQVGQDSFAYTVSDGAASATASLVFSIAGANDAPAANPDVASTGENQAVLIDVLANDADVDAGAVLAVTAASAPAGQGTASVVGNQVEYDPGADFDALAEGESVVVQLSYSIVDEFGAAASSTVDVTVTGANDGPVANPDSAATGENSAVVIDVLANDADPDDGAVLAVTAASAPAGQGSASVVGNQVEFDPGADFDWLAAGESTTVTLSYAIEDEHGTSASSTIDVTVTGANDAPVIDAGGTTATGAVGELPNGDPNENIATHTASGTIAFDDSDLSDTHGASFAAQGAGYLGTFTLDPVDQGGDSVGWDFSVGDADLDFLAEGETRTQTYTITIDDGNGGTATQDVTVTITGAADGPQTVWYIDNSAVGSANAGTEADPFTSIAAFNAAQGTPGGPQAGATVYLLAGTGTGVYAEPSGIVLLDGQALIGVATGAVAPTIAPAAGPGVDLAEDNALSGFDVVATAGAGILDDSAASGSLTMTGVNVTASGIAISLGAASNVSIANATIVSTGSYAILGANVNGFALGESVVAGAAAADATIAFAGLTGDADFLGNTIGGGGGDNLRIVNGSGSLDLTIADGANPAVIGLNDAFAGDDGVYVETSGGASLTLRVDGVDFLGAAGDLLQTAALGSSSHDLTIVGNSFHNAHPATVPGGGGVFLGGGGAGSNIVVDYVVADNSFRGADGSALTALFATTDGAIRGHIEGNVIGLEDGVAGFEGSSGGGDGIFVGIEQLGAGSSTHSVNIVGNRIYDVAFGLGGISLRSNGGGAGGGAILEAVIEDNVVDESGAFAALYAIVGGTAFSGDFARMGLELDGNLLDNGDSAFGGNAVFLDQLSLDAHYYFPGYAGSPDGEWNGGTASDDLDAFLAAKGNVMVNGGFPTFAGGVDAGFVAGVTGDAFVLPMWFP